MQEFTRNWITDLFPKFEKFSGARRLLVIGQIEKALALVGVGKIRLCP